MPKNNGAKLTVQSINPDPNLKSDKGWVNMNLRWLIDEKSVGSKDGVLGFTIFPPGAAHQPHVHKNAEEYIIITKGRGWQSVGDENYEVRPGDIVFVPRNTVHSTKNASDAETLELYFVYAGAPSLEKTGYKPVKAS